MGFDPLSLALEAGKKVLGIGGTLIDRLVPDKNAAREFKEKLAEMAAKGELDQIAQQFEIDKAQIDLNKIEAASTSIFVSGWRPALGWVGAAGFANYFLLMPWAEWGLKIWYPQVLPLPQIDIDALWVLVSGILGLAGARSFEKFKGVASK